MSAIELYGASVVLLMTVVGDDAAGFDAGDTAGDATGDATCFEVCVVVLHYIAFPSME